MKTFKTTGQHTLVYPKVLRDAVIVAIQEWKKFCELPLEEKKKTPYSNNAAGIGYEFKDGSGPGGDFKENMDVTKGPLIDLIRETTLEFAQKCEQEYDLQGFEAEVSRSVFFVRFIHYFGNRELGVETATAHVDQSAFTLHLFESDPGLQCLTYNDKKWVDMPVSEGKTVIIPAMQLQLRSKGELRALAHRVIATESTKNTGRFSSVCFIQLKDTAKYDKDRCGRLQEKEPGFNYKMPIAEFSKMFK